MMPPIEIRVRASTQAGRFHRGPLHLTDSWSPVDLARPDVRDALVAHVGTHVVVHPQDRARLNAAGLRIDIAGRMAPASTSDAAAPPGATAASASSPAPSADPPPARGGRKDKEGRARAA
jgi:hypothetical protein